MVIMDEQVRTLRNWLGKEASLTLAAAKAGMDRKTARKYRQADRLPGNARRKRTHPPQEMLVENGPTLRRLL
jgi:hypothetical protein